MAEAETDLELRRLAEQRVDARQGFRAHATVYMLVNSGLFALNLFTSPQVWWFVWPLFGWGIGLAVHAWAVYGGAGPSREDAIAREMTRLRKQQGTPPRASG